MLEIKTSKKIEFIDITNQINKIIKEEKIKNGICYLFIPHTTAGITINENADPSVKEDIINTLNKIVPEDLGYEHLEGNSPAHIKSSLIGHSEVIFIENGELALGTWQGIFLCEFDGPRKRKVYIKIIER
ncbi:MAG: secondary thiamine-phosphate synthase enzyme YjbQ [Nitrososphaerota archaeon]